MAGFPILPNGNSIIGRGRGLGLGLGLETLGSTRAQFLQNRDRDRDRERDRWKDTRFGSWERLLLLPWIQGIPQSNPRSRTTVRWQVCLRSKKTLVTSVSTKLI